MIEESRLGIIRLRVDGLNIDTLNHLADSAQKIFRAELYKAAVVIHSEIQKATPVGVTGALKRGWILSVSGTQAEPLMVISNPSEYLLATNLGRKAAYVPIEPLTLWVRRKLGITDIKKAKSVAFAISRHKAGIQGPKKAGYHSNFTGPRSHAPGATPGQHFVEKAIDRAMPKAVKNISQVLEVELIKLLKGL